MGKVSVCLTLLILLTTSPMAQWTRQSFPTTEELLRIRFVNEKTGWILAQKHLYCTTDCGATWVSQYELKQTAMALCAVDPNTVFFAEGVTVPGREGTFGIRRTTDGGRTWVLVDSSIGTYYYDIIFPNPSLGFAAGDSADHPVIKKTTDKGLTWRTVARFRKSELMIHLDEIVGISFATPLLGWAVSYRGVLYHTEDGGDSWAYQDSLTDPSKPNRVWDVQFTSAECGWVVGGAGEGLLQRTTDGGKTWQSVAPKYCGNLKEIQMLNSRTGYCVGEFSAEYNVTRTTDGGISWIPSEYPKDAHFNSVSMLDTTTGWVAGSWGNVYRLGSNAGSKTHVQKESSNIKDFELLQNYPNPFNPSTEISYHLPENQFVRISVHDLLGKEITILVNEYKQAGIHSVQFNAPFLPSGMYLYRIEAGKFSASRKLMLIK